MLSYSSRESLKETENNAKKKTTSYYEQDAEKVKEYWEKIKDIPKEEIVYIDETGIDKCLMRKYGRSPKGVKVYGRVYGHKFARTNIVAPLMFEGIMHSLLFEEWFEKHLIPLLSKNTVVVMDNTSFHRPILLNLIL